MTVPAKAVYASSDHRHDWESWRDHLSPFFDISPRDEMVWRDTIGMTTFHLDSMLVGDVSAPAQDLARSSLKIGRQGVDHIVLQLYRTGRSRVLGAGQEVAMGRTDAVVYDMSLPVTIHSDQPVDAYNILFTREQIASEFPAVDRLHAQRYDHQDDAAARLFRDYLAGLVHCGAELQAHQLPGLTQAALKLCGAFLRAPTSEEPSRTAGSRIEIRDFIHRNLADPELGADLLAARFGLSRAALYRELVDEGGVQTYIRERRLLKAMRMLTREGPRGRPRVSSVAYAVGFLDEKSFSRAFRARFGLLPREVRSGEVDGLFARDPKNGLLSWIRDLAT